MAQEQTAPKVTKVTKDPKTPQVSKSQKTTPAAKRKPDISVQALRQELREAKVSHVMEKLDSPAKLRQLRRSLARALTQERAGAKHRVQEKTS